MVLLLFSLSTHLGCAMQNKEKKKVKSTEKGGGGGGKAASGISKKEWRPRGKRGSAGKSGMQRDNLGAKTAKAATSKAAAPP